MAKAKIIISLISLVFLCFTSAYPQDNFCKDNIETLVNRWYSEPSLLSSTLEAIKNNKQDFFSDNKQTFYCTDKSNNLVFDLRGINLSNQVLTGVYVLENADLSFADLTNTAIQKSSLIRTKFNFTSLEGLVLKDVDLSESNIANIKLDPQLFPLTITNTNIDKSEWTKVYLDNSIITKLYGGSIFFSEVSLSNTRIDSSSISLEGNTVKFFQTELENSDLEFLIGRNIDFTKSRLRRINLSSSRFIDSIFDFDKLESINLQSVRLESPSFGELNLDTINWSLIIWDNFEINPHLHHETTFFRNTNLSQDYHHIKTLNTYNRLELKYDQINNKKYSNGFKYQRLKFIEDHEPTLKKTLLYFFLNLTDRYGTSGYQLFRTFLVSILVVFIIYLILHIYCLCFCTKKGWASFIKNGEKKIKLELGVTKLALHRQTGFLILATISTCLLFAGKILNIDGFEEMVGNGRLKFQGISSIVAGFSSIWFLYLAIRGLSMLYN